MDEFSLQKPLRSTHSTSYDSPAILLLFENEAVFIILRLASFRDILLNNAFPTIPQELGNYGEKKTLSKTNIFLVKSGLRSESWAGIVGGWLGS